ncbi:MAG TPA: DUF4430 domain-containing protein [Candidatus Saccharibacteria bacterium]|nr:DUF4430 domain-containing protein [Candidatus Saccharibacteria bacterium]HRN96969.1 DUF4430 domain-containing protein [Candidatus Saccharibacteria bacterium]HRQ07148.1 DUF4430 domain-containing protein [Candidatus Saccharibacteria bacterium]HRQ98042.1 DUF4430 domain-containing protein [Candidatus Saccharibacteria bacterium]
MMKRTNIYIISIVAAVILLVTGILWTLNRPNERVAEQPSNSIIKSQRTEIIYTAKPGETSLKQLKEEANDVITKTSDFGEYVDSIEGHQGGTDGKYWSFYINGTMSDVGADSYMQKGGEVITWKFQKL